ncbi:helix-turn-helix domain-containing protein [Bosea thiooxidans]
MKSLVTVRAIVDAVAATTGLTRTDIMSARRTPEIVEARSTVFWLARELTGGSYDAIGAAVGHRDHTTVLSGCDRAAARRERDSDYRTATDTLRGILQALEDNKMLAASTVADPLGTARRIIASPAREAVRVPVIEIVAMARLIVELLGETDPSELSIMENSDAD